MAQPNHYAIARRALHACCRAAAWLSAAAAPLSCGKIEQVEEVLIGGTYKLTYDHKLSVATIGSASTLMTIEPHTYGPAGPFSLSVGGIAWAGTYICGYVSASDSGVLQYYFILDTATEKRYSDMDRPAFDARIQSLVGTTSVTFIDGEQCVDRLSPRP